MESINPQNNDQNGIEQDNILNRVNQTFNKMSQEVKIMIDENKQQIDNQ